MVYQPPACRRVNTMYPRHRIPPFEPTKTVPCSPVHIKLACRSAHLSTILVPAQQSVILATVPVHTFQRADLPIFNASHSRPRPLQLANRLKSPFLIPIPRVLRLIETWRYWGSGLRSYTQTLWIFLVYVVLICERIVFTTGRTRGKQTQMDDSD